MEIIANIENHPSFTIEKWFYKNFRNPLMPPLHKDTVGKVLENRNLVTSTEQFLKMPWQGIPGIMSSARSIHGINHTRISLIYLLKTKNGDKMVLSCLGDEKSPHDIMTVGYSGSPGAFKQYLQDMSIPEFVIYSKLHHYIED